MSKLFLPLQIGNNALQHRVVMAPLTRLRASDNHVPSEFAKKYYEQRASVSGTLLIAEGTIISPRGGGGRNVPGIWSPDQIAAWKHITTAVHEKGSFIWCQLWAAGRAASPEVLEAEGGYKVTSSSAIPITPDGVKPKPLTEEEIWDFIGDYTQAAKNAIEAGFDGVEIHGANGYLVDQFIQDVSNDRTDAWGGSIEGRSKFAYEVAKAISATIGPEKTGIRFSPFSTFQGMRMKDPIAGFSYVITRLKGLKLAYLHFLESQPGSERTEHVKPLADIWGNTSPVLIAGLMTPELARKVLDDEYRDSQVAAVFGRYFLSNPDLPFRIKENIELNLPDEPTFYQGKGEDGYTDYPFSKEFVDAQHSVK